jgi:toxin ParE1/3/4
VKSPRYLLPAILEFERAVDRYAEYSPRLARVLHQAIVDSVERIRHYPEIGSVLDPPVRRVVLSSHPFSVLYYVHDNTVIIVAIMHHRQEPGYWRDRLELGRA